MGLRDGMRRETARIKGRLRDNMKILCSGNVLKYIKANLKKSLNNERDRVSTGHLLPPNEASSIRIGLHQIELLAKGSITNNPNYFQD